MARHNNDPRVHFLLAQIYMAKRDRPDATLREYLKFATHPEDVAVVQKYLSQLEAIRLRSEITGWSSLAAQLFHSRSENRSSSFFR
jgi:hypothetical protein